MMRNQSNFRLLPQNILIEILLRLPFESILACKRTSKQLKNLINDPKFSSLYGNKSMALFLGKEGVYCALARYNNEIDVNGGCDPTRYTVHHIPMSMGTYQVNNSLYYELLSGWSDGIACVKGLTGYFLLYNMFTGASRIVSNAPLREKYKSTWICYGFGYDRCDDDYKIMLVCDSTEGSMFDKSNVTIRVYSCRNRVWKSFQGFPYGARKREHFQRGCSFNGVIHWTLGKHEDLIITNFDLHSSKFGKMLAPIGYRVGPTNLTELDRRLCFVNVYNEFGWLELWVMEEYGVRESWTKLLSINRLVNRSIPWDLNLVYTTTCNRGNGKVVLFVSNGLGLFWYDINENKLEVGVDATWHTTSGQRKRKKSSCVARGF